MKLKEYIDKYAVKQAVLARRANICQQTLIRAIRGEYINFRTACKISSATEGEVTPFDLCDTSIVVNQNSNNTAKKKKKEKTGQDKKTKLRVIPESK